MYYITAMCLQVQAMDFKDPNGLSRIVQSLTISVDDAERFHPPEAALQTKQYLSTIRAHLGHTLRRECPGCLEA